MTRIMRIYTDFTFRKSLKIKIYRFYICVNPHYLRHLRHLRSKNFLLRQPRPKGE